MTEGMAERFWRKGSSGSFVEALAAKTGDRGPIAPQFVEWLMNFPTGWTDCEPSETPSSPPSPSTSAGD